MIRKIMFVAMGDRWRYQSGQHHLQSRPLAVRLRVPAGRAVGTARRPQGRRQPEFSGPHPHIGLDWFILDLLGSSPIFIFIEKLFKLRKEQPVFRPEWQTDFHHFIVNHAIVGFVLLATNLMVHKFFRLGRSTRHSRLGAGAAVLGRRAAADHSGG